MSKTKFDLQIVIDARPMNSTPRSLFAGMIARLLLLLLSSLVWTSGVAEAGASGERHPTHVCRGEIDFNPDTQCLEFAVCLYLEDVRTVLHRRSDEVIFFSDEDSISPFLKEYLHNNFWVATESKTELSIDWYGYEIDPEGLWMYFEVPVNGTPEGLVIGNRMLLEIQPGNVSVFRFRWGKKRSNQLFNSQTVGQKLVWVEGRKQIESSERSISLAISKTIEANQKNAGKQQIPAYDPPPRPRLGSGESGSPKR